ncbi:uncharacterized protein LOC143446696 [Clavelina lepadiformis]|uniref:uncharacterized protein LOC143446696 n=1 Tax=Clavelina lepadiformis TaxID=159417 RepID=UPI0040438BFB
MLKTITALFLLSVVTGADQECRDAGGACLYWPTNQCMGGWADKDDSERNCTGGNHFRCCMGCDAQCMEEQEDWSVDDEPCEEALGTCQNSTNFCNGKYEDGLCGGPGDRKCCDTKQEGDCQLVEYEPTANVVGYDDVEIRIHPDFVASLDAVGDAARYCGVKVRVVFSFRKRRFIKNRNPKIDLPKYSNFHVGHAVHVFLETIDGICFGTCIADAEKPGAGCFTYRLTLAGLNWGGSELPFDIDDGFNSDVTNWKNLFRELKDVC